MIKLTKSQIKYFINENDIFNKSRFIDDIDNDYNKFVDRYYFIYSVFCGYKNRKIDSYLFGKYQECNFLNESFEPFWNAIIRLCEKIDNNQYFIEGAFSSWKDSFVSSLSNIWNNVFNSTINDIIKTKNDNIDNDFEKEIIWDGTLFETISIRYPILVRQIIDFCYLQYGHIKEIIGAVLNDLSNNFDKFFYDCKMGKVVNVSATESDRHNGGRSIHIITFDDGKKIVYKPHDMEIDIAFYKFMNYISNNININYRNVEIVKTENGAFCEFYEHSDLKNIESAKIFYKNDGMLLAIIYLLLGSDIHMENIIACGNFPRIVDLETVIINLSIYKESYIKDICDKYTVNDTLFLPIFIKLPGFKDLKHDSISSCNDGFLNYPTYDGKKVLVDDYIDDVCEGFNKVLNFVISDKKQVKEKIREYFSNCLVRVILRNTFDYMVLLKVLGNKESIVDKNSYDRVTKIMISVNDSIKDTEKNRILKIENDALRILDVPYINCNIDEKTIFNLCDRIENINENDILNSVQRIKFSLKKYKANDKSLLFNDLNYEENFDIENNNTYLSNIAKLLARYVDNNMTKIICIPPENTMMFANSLNGHMGIFDGNLGVLISLASYLKIIDNDEEVKSVLDKLYKKITDKLTIVSAISPEYMGIPDGISGLLIGITMLFEFSAISESDYREIICLANKLKDRLPRININNNYNIFNNLCYLVALNRMNKKYITDDLLDIKNYIISLLKENKEFLSFNLDDFTKAVKNDLSNNSNINIDKFSNNNTFRFGNAGTLYNYINSTYIDEMKIKKFINKLLKEKNMIKGLIVPNDVCEFSFTCGLSGTLYSVCKAILKEKIPNII